MLTYNGSIEHPIKMYIKKDLAMTIDHFASISGINQSTIAMWIKRNRKVEDLPIYFYASLSQVANRSIDQIYRRMLEWQQTFAKYQYETYQLIESQKPLFTLAAEEGIQVYHDSKNLARQNELLEPTRKLRKALDKDNPELYMENIIKIYAIIERVMPVWLTKITTEPEEFQQVGKAFYNQLILK